MKKFEIYLKEKNGDLDYINYATSKELAENIILQLEFENAKNGVYVPNSFVIKEVEIKEEEIKREQDAYATEILNNLFSNFNKTFSNFNKN